ncbi:MAG: hypothetical protein CM15mP115_21670 [Alphaproteobacteria bacterium]|nr:MAG: hypothetical protein CM15mP115_21670 [Alphaproteobacteria bacterium]
MQRGAGIVVHDGWPSSNASRTLARSNRVASIKKSSRRCGFAARLLPILEGMKHHEPKRIDCRCRIGTQRLACPPVPCRRHAWHSPRATVKRPFSGTGNGASLHRFDAASIGCGRALRRAGRQASARRTSSSTTPRRGFAGRSQILTPGRREPLSKSPVSAPSWSPSRRHGGCWRAARVASCSPAHLPGSRGSPNSSVFAMGVWAAGALLPRRSPATLHPQNFPYRPFRDRWRHRLGTAGPERVTAATACSTPTPSPNLSAVSQPDRRFGDGRRTPPMG